MPENNDGSNNGPNLADWVKSAISSGMESVGEIKNPRDAIFAAIASADKTKKDVASAIAGEVKKFLASFEMQEMIIKLLDGATFEINATIKVVAPKEGKVKVEKFEAKKAAPKKPAAKRPAAKPRKTAATRKKPAAKK